MSTQADIILNKICQIATENKASEIFLLPGQIPFMRINGKIESISDQKIVAVSFLESLTKILLDDETIEKLIKERQIEIIKEIGKIGQAQINFYFQKSNFALRIELLAKKIGSLKEMNMPKIVTNMVEANKGIIFITGPKDSGRMELTSAILNYINKRKTRFISTIESPIRINIHGVKSIIEQREVGKDVGSFLSGLSYVRKRNIDVVMISKVGGEKIINELFAIAEAGSLILAVMDTGDSIKTIKRILHFFPSQAETDIRYFLSESLAGIISCRLVPKIGGGRIHAVEALTATPAVRSVIAGGKFHQLSGLLQASEDRTSISLDQYLVDLVAAGKIMNEQAFKYCTNPEIVKALLKR